MIAHFAAALLVSTASGTTAQLDWETLTRTSNDAMPATLIVHEPVPLEEIADQTEHGRQAPGLVESYLVDDRGEPLRGDNAWPALMVALEHMAAVLEVAPEEGETRIKSTQWPSFMDIYDPNPRPAQRQEALDALATLEREGFFEMLTMLMTEQRFIPPAQPGPMVEWEFPELQQLRSAARACAARMHVAAQQGDFDRAVEAFEHLLFLGRAATHRPSLIGHLVGIAIMALGETHIRHVMWEHQLEPRHLRAVQGAMERQSRFMPIALAFEGEALIQQDSVDVLFGPDGAPDREKFDEWHMEVPHAAAIAGPDESAEFLADLSQRIVEASRLPTWQALSQIEQIEAEGVPQRHAIAGVLLPAFTRSMLARVQLEAALGGLELMLAIERFAADHGEYPPDLAALSPRYLPDLPLDPYTGEPYRYRLLDRADDDHGRGYLLYSVGLDRTDHGGRMHERGNFMAASPQGLGFDFIINAPPR